MLSSLQDGVMVLSATHRYRKKYVTTLLYKPIWSPWYLYLGNPRSLELLNALKARKTLGQMSLFYDDDDNDNEDCKSGLSAVEIWKMPQLMWLDFDMI